MNIVVLFLLYALGTFAADRGLICTARSRSSANSYQNREWRMPRPEPRPQEKKEDDKPSSSTPPKEDPYRPQQ